MCLVFVVSVILYENHTKVFQKILIIFNLFFIVLFYGIYCNIRAKLKKTGRKL